MELKKGASVQNCLRYIMNLSYSCKRYKSAKGEICRHRAHLVDCSCAIYASNEEVLTHLKQRFMAAAEHSNVRIIRWMYRRQDLVGQLVAPTPLFALRAPRRVRLSPPPITLTTNIELEVLLTFFPLSGLTGNWIKI